MWIPKRPGYVLLAALLVTTLFGCEDWIDDVEPKASISSEVALTSRAGFEALIISGYDRLQQTNWYGQVFVLFPDALSDNANVTQPNSNRYPGPVANTRGSHFGIWASAYANINEMNNVIAKIDALQLTLANAQQAAAARAAA